MKKYLFFSVIILESLEFSNERSSEKCIIKGAEKLWVKK